MKAPSTVPAARVFRGSFAGWLLAVSLLAAVAPAGAETEPDGKRRRVSEIRLIEGRGDMFEPATGAANLDLGLVAGATRWERRRRELPWNDTYVGFLWDAAGPTEVFAISRRLYYNDNIHFVNEISPGRTVVGSDYFRRLGKALPFLWTPAGGFRFLPTPCSNEPAPGQACGGIAAAIAADGRSAVGTVQRSRSEPAQAALWSAPGRGERDRFRLELLPSPGRWSNALDVSSDGAVIVGDSGPDESHPGAIVWDRSGGHRPLAVGEASSAVFVSEDGAGAIGWAVVEGRRVLVRWNRGRRPTVAAPPGDLTLESIRAVNPSATAAVGALSEDGNWAPFLWTLRGGFTLIGELGRERDYDRSVALDVSDDGRAVVGVIEASFVNDGDPRAHGFLWTTRGGLATINKLVSRAGLAEPDYYRASAISGDGRRILATGNPPRSQDDTNSVLITLEPARRSE